MASSVKEQSKVEAAVRHRMATDFEFYAANNLTILTKDGRRTKLILNAAQRHIHNCLERQLKETGKVRALLLKARQQGGSTYVGGRYYWKTTFNEACGTFILSHAKDTTKKLFNMTHRFHKNCDGIFKQVTDRVSTTELNFPVIDSSYTVGTAGATEVGRGGTIRLLHGSEVAFWPNAAMHFAGLVQSVPTGTMGGGTEIILESTANGMNGVFYDMCMEAQNGDSEYQLIFTPWFWQVEYSETPPAGWEVPDSEQSYMDAFELTKGQMYWRQLKTRELGSEWKFKQEYPATVDEAFQASNTDSFISSELALAIRSPKEEILDGDNPRIGACDPAWTGDRTAIGHRTGKRVHDIEYHKNKDPNEIANLCVIYIKKYNLDRMFVDVVGYGAGVYSILKAMGYGHIVRPVNFAGKAVDLNSDGTMKYKNKRAECWARMRDDMEDGYYEIPNSDELVSDLTAPTYHYNNPQGALQLESKKDMKSRGVASPDGGDVISMTYSEPVYHKLRQYPNSGIIVKSEYDVLSF